MRRAPRIAPGTRRVLTYALGALLTAGQAACGNDGPVAPRVVPPGAGQLTATKLAALAVSIATGNEGSGPLDNFIGCTRRGVIDYTNTPTGRRATIAGCNLGDSVVVDGDVEVRWVSGGDRTQIRRIELVGPLTVRVADTTRTVSTAVVEDVSFASGIPSIATARLDQMRVTLFDSTFTPDVRGTEQRVFGAFGLTLTSIPGTGGPAGLSAEDARRIAFQLGTLFLAVTLDELGRPPHAHALGCGVVDVAPGTESDTNVVHFQVEACDFGRELLVSGDFTMDLRAAAVTPEAARYVIEGPMTLGGGVARTMLTGFEWAIEMPDGLPGVAMITLTLVDGQNRWEYNYTVPLDD